MSEAIDRIITELIARDNGYVATFRAAAREVRGLTTALAGLAQIEAKGAEGAAASAAVRRRAKDTEGAAAKRAASEVDAAVKASAAAEKEAARTAAAAVRAAERQKQLDLKATEKQREAAARTAERAAQRERDAATAATAAVERETATRVRLAAVAERAAARTTITPGSGRNLGITVPREVSGQRGIPAGVLAGAGDKAEVEAQAEINHLLADRASLQARLSVAAGTERDIIRDELRQIQLFNSFKRASLSDEQAAVRVERELLTIEAARTRQAAERAVLMEKQLRAQSTKTASTITAFAPTLIGGITAHEISALNDAYITLGNTLRIAGVSAGEFDQVQGHLLATANRSGTDINALADVYRGAALASHDLGASQDDLLKITDAAANALRISGRSSEEARGGLLQLSHAFESGKVTAREFNGLALNLYPILQAVARGSDEFGGSVAKLRQALLDGDLSSKVFFQDLLKGSDDLAERAGKATLTTAQGFNALRNSLIVYFGEADKAQGVSAALGSALQALAGNLDTLIPAIGAVALALTTGYIVRLGAAAAATEGLGAAILAAFGGPIGLTITALALTVGTFAVEANRSSEIVAKANEAYAEMHDRLQAATLQATAASGGVAGVGSDALGAIPKVNAFAGAVGNLAQQLYNQARAARAARVESLSKQLVDSQQREVQLGEASPAGRADQRAQNRAALRRGDILGVSIAPASGALANFFSGGRTDRESQQAYRRQAAVSLDLQRQLSSAKIAPITPGDISGGIPGADNPNAARIATLQGQVADLEKLKAKASGRELATINRAIGKREKQIGYLEQGVSAAAATAASAGGGVGRRGPSSETLAHRAEAARLKSLRDDRAYDAALRQAETSYLSEKADLTNSASDQAEVERQRVKFQRDQFAKEIASKGPGGTGEYTAAEVANLQGINTRTADLRLKSIDLAERRRAADDLLNADRATLELKRDELQSQQQTTDTLADRHRIGLQLLDLDYQLRKKELDAVLAADSKATAGERAIAADRLKALPSQKERDRKLLDRQDEGAGASYLRGLDVDHPQFIESEQVKLLQGFNEELDNSVTKALHLHGIFGTIIGDLIDMAIKQALIKPLANALFGGAGQGGGGGGGFFGSILGAVVGAFGGGGTVTPGAVGGDGISIGKLFENGGIIKNFGGGRASGGAVSAGKTYLIGERGPELLRFGQSGSIVPNHALSVSPNVAAANVRVNSPQGNSVVIVQPIHADFTGARTDEQTLRQFTQYADARSKQAYEAAVQASGKQVAGIVQRKQTLG